MDKRTIISGLLIALSLAALTLLCAMSKLSADAVVGVISGLVAGFVGGRGSKDVDYKKILAYGGILGAMTFLSPGCSWFTAGQPVGMADTVNKVRDVAQECLIKCSVQVAAKIATGGCAPNAALDELMKCGQGCAGKVLEQQPGLEKCNAEKDKVSDNSAVPFSGSSCASRGRKEIYRERECREFQIFIRSCRGIDRHNTRRIKRRNLKLAKFLQIQKAC